MPLYAYGCHVEIDLRADHAPRTEPIEDLKRNRSEEKIRAQGADNSDKVLDSSSAKSDGVLGNWAQFVSDQEIERQESQLAKLGGRWMFDQNQQSNLEDE